MSFSLEVLNLYLIGVIWLTKFNPWGTDSISVLSLKSEVTVQSILMWAVADELLPSTILFCPVVTVLTASVPARYPSSTLLLPPVTLDPASFPIAVLFPPSVTDPKEAIPTAELPPPVVFGPNYQKFKEAKTDWNRSQSSRNVI